MTLVGILCKPFEKPKRYEFNLNSYMDFYNVLKCDTFDIATRKFGGKYYDVYVDDEGLLYGKDVAMVCLDKNGHVKDFLVGNCFICKHNKKGDTISLTDKDIERILACVKEGVMVYDL